MFVQLGHIDLGTPGWHVSCIRDDNVPTPACKGGATASGLDFALPAASIRSPRPRSTGGGENRPRRSCVFSTMSVLRHLDRPVARVHRTPRELLIIGVAAATAATSWHRHGASDLGNLLAFAGIVVAFATRFFAARVIATAVAVAAAGLHVSYAWRAGWAPRELLSVAYFLTAILVLGGRALVASFDDAPARGALLPNFWRELATADRRRLAFLVHGVALTLAMLYYVRYALVTAAQPVPGWLAAGLAGGALVAALLLAGRAVAAAIALVGGGALAAVLWAHAPFAWPAATGAYVAVDAPAVVRVAPQLLLGAAAAATVTALAAAPWASRLLRLGLRRAP